MALLMPALLLLTTLKATPDAFAAPPIRLQALTATSGGDAATLLDGGVETGWRPEGDALGEGVLLRFEEPVRITTVALLSCGGTYSVETFVNGQSFGHHVPTPTGAEVQVSGRTNGVQSIFLKVATASAPPCLGEVRFLRARTPVPVLAPRRVSGRVSASSTLAPAAAYHPSYLFDARIDFGWVEGSKGKGEGEAVTVELDQPLEIAALELWNGYQRSPVHFEKNARARKVALVLDDGTPIPFELKDVKGAQKLTLPAPVRAKRIRLAIESVYPGTKYPDMVLSELRFWDSAGPVSVGVTDRAAMREALVSELGRSAVARLLGKHLSNGCPGDEGEYWRTLKLRPDHTFVAYERVSDPMGSGSTSEVFDGTWVPSGRAGAWTEIELFGRRHRVDESWDPYAENPQKVKESDRIAGGKLRIAIVGELPPAERTSALASAETGAQIGACMDREAPAFGNAVVVRGPQLTDLFAASGR